MQTSFLELRCKEVINIVDGRLLGHIVDMVIDVCTSRVTGLVVPGAKTFFSFFKPGQEIFIPYKNICKIGDDVILVELYNLPQVKKNKDACICNRQDVEMLSERVNDDEPSPISPRTIDNGSIRSKITDQNLEN